MSAMRAATFCDARWGGGDHNHLRLREHAGEGHLDITGSGGHVDHQIVQFSPVDLFQELLQCLGEHQPPPHQGRLL